MLNTFLSNITKNNIQHLKTAPAREEKGHYIFAAVGSLIVYFILHKFVGFSFFLFFHMSFVFILSLYDSYAKDFQRELLQSHDKYLIPAIIRRKAFLYPIFSGDYKVLLKSFPVSRKLILLGRLYAILLISLPFVWLAKIYF